MESVARFSAVVALALVALLGIAAFSIDVGYAYYAKRQLQSATDAAALAGAQDLPNGTTAIATATVVRAREHARESLELQLHVPDDVHGHGGHRRRAATPR